MKNWTALLVAGGLSVSAAHANSVNLVVNGDFGTTNFSGWTEFNTGGTDKVVGPYLFDSVWVAPHSGSCQARLGTTDGIGGIEQTLTVTPGHSYKISYWLCNLGGTPSEYDVTWGGISLVDKVSSDAFDYTEFTFQVLATSSTETLSFGLLQVPNDFLLDDVSVAAVPEDPAFIVSGAILLVPFGAGALRMFRQRQVA
jgi:hypothetical protein